jgi:adenylate cyclase
MVMAQKALAIDDSLPDIHGLLSSIYGQKREYDKCIAEGERAVALDPNGALANEWYAGALFYANRIKEAIPMYQKAIRLNPIGSSNSFQRLAACYGRTGRFEEAVSANKQAILRSPDSMPAHLNLASNYIAMGREKEARAEAAEVLRINPKFSLDAFSKGIAYMFPDQSALDRYIGSLRKAGLK